MLMNIELNETNLVPSKTSFEEKSFSELNITENQIEEFIRVNIGEILEDETLLMVGQQVRNLERGRNDLVAIDENGSLVLIEIKRDAEDMARRSEPLEFQSIRYAASCATIKAPEELVELMFEKYITTHTKEIPEHHTQSSYALEQLITFLESNNAVETFNQKQRIMLFASSYDKQALSAFAWLINAGVDITLYTITPYLKEEQLLVDIKRILPLDNIEDYYVQLQRSTGTYKKSSTQRSPKTLPRMGKLMEWGIIKEKDKVQIKGKPNSAAIVHSEKEVKYNNEILTFNQWGQKITGWNTINIYDWAELVKEDSAILLSELRKQKMAELEGLK
ncbi:hypothetical protein [Lysinibacillus antri]|uniref:RAMA domain-containing protein n=1 Tax=Lysinibacillus antri TaxID=2498145 RepID=A0A432LHU5_9BACI|nr:hypothetical protein [Lysinibacillus antri]RUL55947.1 hypothetical protein EK386_03775 [Lysinibacillus antri]